MPTIKKAKKAGVDSASVKKEEAARERKEAERNAYRAQDKKQVKALTDYANKNTSLEKASLYLKPIALLDYYTPLVKIRIFSPTKELGGYGEDTLFTSVFQAANGQQLEMNNYVQTFSYEASAGKQDVSIRLVDLDLDFSDTILMRFSRDFENGIYLEVEYGWSNKENGSALIKNFEGEPRVVHFTNKIVCNLKDIEVDEDASGKRTLTLIAHLFNNLPGKLSQVTPYNELGPMPIMTYQLIRFLALDKKGMYEILEIASAVSASTGKKITKAETDSLKDKTMVSVLGGSSGEYKTLIEEFAKAKKTLAEVSPNDSRIKTLNLITETLKTGTGEASVDSVNKVEKLFNTTTFKELLRGDDSFAKKAEELVRKFSTILRDIRIHPWACYKFILQAMQQKFKDAEMPAGTIIYNDFAGFTDYTNSKFESDSFDIRVLKNHIVGWNDADILLPLNKNYKNNETLRLVGILPTDISVTPGTDWQSLLNMCISRCYIFTKKNFETDTDGDIKLQGSGVASVPKTETNDELKKRFNKDSLSSGVFQVAANKYRKIEPLKLQAFNTNKNNVLDILNGIILLNDAKSKQSVLSSSEFDNFSQGSVSLKAEAKLKNQSLAKTFKRVKDDTQNEMYYVINIYNNKQGQLFDNNFARQNIQQAYSYRFSTQRQYASTFNPGLPSVKMINFPDVFSFKANLKGMLWLQDIVSASRNLKLDVSSSSGGSNLRFVSSNQIALKSKLDETKLDIKRLENIDEKKRSADDNKKITDLRKEVDDIKKLLSSKINDDESTFVKYKYPIYINAKIPASFVYGNGVNNNDVAILKNNIVNFRKRLLISGSFQPEATLEIFGDPSFSQIVNLGTALVYIRVYNPDGSDSMHTGIYRLNGFKHDIQSGSFKTVLMLKKETMHENIQLKQQLENIIYMDAITKEESWDAIKEQEEVKVALKKKREQLTKELASDKKLTEAEKQDILKKNSNIDFALSNSIDASKKREEFTNFSEGELVDPYGNNVGAYGDTGSAKATTSGVHTAGSAAKALDEALSESASSKQLIKLTKPI